MKLKNWIVNRERTGKSCFSRHEVAEAFPMLSANAIDSALSRFTANRLIQSVHRGYYSVIPAHYALVGRLPPEFYINGLMNWIGRPYYVALHSAASIFGAQHQKAMVTQVMVQMPHISTSVKKNPDIDWLYRRKIPSDFLLWKNGENGVIAYSNAELTAVDLVRYANKAGGMSPVATVLAELRETTNFANASEGVFRTADAIDIQRLGYIYEEMLGDVAQADMIYSELARMNVTLRTGNLNPTAGGIATTVNRRWRLKINELIEIDDL